MDALPLHLKYRPKTFEEVMGNDATIESLSGVVSREERQVRAFLLTGPSGCGKTTLARIIAGQLGCADREFLEYNAAKVRGIDTIREVLNNCRFLPLAGKVKIYMFDEAHKLTNEAQNALLKPLEDTPQHVRFILATTDPEKLIEGVRTRCSTYTVAPLQRVKIFRLLKNICEQEGKVVSPDVLKRISEVCQGSPRQALVVLDQVIDLEDDDLAMQTIVDSTVDDVKVIDLCRLLMNKGRTWKQISDLLRGLTGEPETIRYNILGYLTSVLLNKDSVEVLRMIEIFADSWMYSGRAGLVSSCYMVYKKQ